jgi:release factor glutamine methyltransferase
MTIGEALRDATARLGPSGSDSPRQEAGWLLRHVLRKTTTWLTVHDGDRIHADTIDSLRSLLLRRLGGEPLSYVLAEAEFYSRRFYVDSRVLVPRPESEQLVERAIKFARENSSSISSSLRVVDLGTGSGVLAITLALELADIEVIASDISEPALDVARINVDRHKVGQRVALRQSDLLGNFHGPIDLLVANLPYVRSDVISELQPEVRREPRLALDGGPDGFAAYRRLFQQARSLVSPVGGLFFEIGDDQGLLARSEAESWFPDRDVKIISDLAGRDRVVAITPRTGRTN